MYSLERNCIAWVEFRPVFYPLRRQTAISTHYTEGTVSSAPTDEAMGAARKALEQWQTPEQFVSKVESFAPLVKSSVLFNKPNAQFLLDAIPIAEFSKHRPLKSIRLAEQHDSEAKDDTGTFDIEVTEIQEPGRRRGDEYRCGVPALTHSEFDPNLGKTIASQLAKGVQKKADRKYGSKPLLLIYLNISTGGRLGNEVEAAIKEERRKHAIAFREICVLWAGKLY
jgi:hypothetical protein